MQAYWFYQLSDINYEKRYRSLRLDQSTLIMNTNLSYGLPTDEAIRVCRQRYKNDVAKLTLQIADQNVMQIRKSVRLTFSDQLAIIGKILVVFFIRQLFPDTNAICRWDPRTLRRGQPHKPGGGSLLGV